MIVHYPTDTAEIEKRLDKIQNSIGSKKWWENTWIQVLVILGAISGIFALVFALFPPVLGGVTWWPWLMATAIIFLIFSGLKIYWQRNKDLVFILDEMQSFWSHAPQPDGRKLTQISLKGHVTNISNQSLFLANISLISPKTRTLQRFIFTVHNNAVDSRNRPIVPGDRTEFSSHFFVEGFIGTIGKPLTMTVSITDSLSRQYKVKFLNLRNPKDY